jgi:orotate phosphoribosyltransferase
MSETHEVLGHDLVRASVLRGSFQLRSGAQSSYYIDKYLFTTQPDLLRIAAELSRGCPGRRLAGPVLGGCYW